MNNNNIYLIANGVFALIVAGFSVVRDAGVNPIYLIVLFALCSSAAIGAKRLNDRYSLLIVFSGVYFLYYGVLPLLNLLFGTDAPLPTESVLSMTDAVILVGAALVQISYRVACRAAVSSINKPSKDWSERSMVFVGGTLWIVCTWMTWQFKIHILVSTLSEDVAKGLGSLSPWQAGAFILAVMLQPLGVLIATYAQSKYQRAYMTPVLIGMVLVQLLMGFVADVKADAITGALIVVITKLLTDGRIAKSWVVAVVAFIVIAFPVLQANRIVRGMTGADHSDAARNIGQTIEKAIEVSKEAKSGSDRPQTFFERLSLVGSVQIIVTRTGTGNIEFQNGYTMINLLTTFVPRIIWPNKPSVETGRLMNKEFQISPVEDTYISPSHLGELYWNFGWIGVIVGMLAIGSLFGYLGGRFNFENSVTLTHLMISIVTIRLLVMGFEGTIAVQYTVWMRSMLAIGLLHLILARAPGYGRTSAAVSDSARLPLPLQDSVGARFSNLMR